MRLMRVVGALSSINEVFDDSGRLIHADGEGRFAALQLILSEIEETIMRRNLLFRSSAAQSLTIEVMERRVMQITQADCPIAARQLVDEVIGRPLTSDDTGQVFEVLQAFCADTKKLHLVSQLPTEILSSALDGVSWCDLSRLSASAVANQTLPGNLAVAIDATKAVAHALVSVGKGKTQTKFGDPAACNALARLMPLAENPTREASLRVWSIGQSSIFAAQLDRFSVWVIASEANARACHSLWHNALFDGAPLP